MSAEHRRVHYYMVRELPRAGKALRPEFITKELSLPAERVTAIQDELEKQTI